MRSRILVVLMSVFGLLVAATAQAATSTTITVVPGGPKQTVRIVSGCEPAHVLTVLAILSVLLLAAGLVLQSNLIFRNGLRAAIRHALGWPATVCLVLSGVLMVVGHHLAAVTLFGLWLWAAGIAALYLATFGRPRRFDRRRAESPRQRTERRVFNGATFGITVIGFTAGMAMVFAGGVRVIWG